MSLFNKVARGASNLFNKVVNDKSLMSKVHSFAHGANDTMERAGNFLVPAVSMVNPAYGAALSGGLVASHKVLNGLEKATRE